MCEYCKNHLQLCNAFRLQELQFCSMKITSLVRIKNMNTTELNRGWDKQKSELIQKFAILTENDLIFEEGEKEEMFKKLRIRLGKTKEELKKIIAAF